MKSITLITAFVGFTASALNAQSDVNTTVIQGAFQDFSNSAGGRTFTGVDFHAPEATTGSPYLFDKWVKGSVVNSNDTVVSNPSFLFNYNKMSGALMLTQDRQTYIELDKGSYKSFTLKDALGNTRTFEKVPTVNPNVLVEVISKGSNYGVYKLIKTRYKKADYRTDGLTETGDKDNQYIDEYEYYVVGLKAKAQVATKFTIRKKSIKEAFSNDVAKVEAYFSQHKEDEIDEAFVRGLGEYLNQ